MIKLYPRTLGDYVSLLVVPIWVFLGIMISVHLCLSAWLKSNAWFLDSNNARALIHTYIVFDVLLFIVAWLQFRASRPHRFGGNFFIGLGTALYLIFAVIRPWALG